MRLNCQSAAVAVPPFRARKWLSCLAALSLAACNFPTEAPELEQRWVIPLDETRFGVAELLDAGEVDLNADSTAFLVTFDPVQFQETLGTLCPLCLAADGLTVPKPAFLNSFQSDVAFPASVSAVTLSSGEVEIFLENGFNFDPLQPGGGLTGSITISITDSSDGDVLGTLVLDGTTTSLPAFSSRTDTVGLVAGSVEGTLEATATVDSPAGDNVTLDSSAFLTATATPMDIVVSGVDVDVSGESVELDPVELDLQDVEEDVADRVRCEQVPNGALARCQFRLDVENPFGVEADFTLRIVRPGLSDLVKTVAIEDTGSSTALVDFTAEEIRSLLGRSGIQIIGSAVVSGAAGVISVAPGDELLLEATMDITLALGG